MTNMDPARRRASMSLSSAGFAGLYALHRLRSQGLSVRVFEAAPDVGGTWYYNRYPGARCDVRERRLPLLVLRHCSNSGTGARSTPPRPRSGLPELGGRQLDLRRDITFGTRVSSVILDEPTVRWTVRTDGGGRSSRGSWSWPPAHCRRR